MKAKIINLVPVSERVFPVISSSLYESTVQKSATPDQNAAIELLLWSRKSSPFWQSHLGWRLDPPGQLIRLLQFHRLALQAELRGELRQADFFWESLYEQAAGVFASNSVWEASSQSLLAQHPQAERVKDTAVLRERFTREVLIDTHAALFNGHLEEVGELDADHRAWRHLDYILKACDLIAAPISEVLLLVTGAYRSFIDALAKAGRWEEGVATCYSLLQLDPNSIENQNELIELRWREMLAQPDTPATLNWAMQVFVAIRNTYQLNELIYRRLAQLYQQRAYVLVKLGFLSTALVAIEEASIFDPDSAEIATDKQKLHEAMQATIEKAKALRDEMRNHRSPTVSEEFATLLDEARAGFTPLKRFRESDEFKLKTESMQRVRTNALAVPKQPEQVHRYGYIPIIPASSVSPKQTGEPLSYWLLSGRDKRLKVQAIAASVILIVVGGLAFKDLRARRIRDDSYQTILQAAANRRHIEVIRAAEVFLSHPVVVSSDSREDKVKERYSEALVLWIARQPADLDHEASEHVARYRKLVGTSK